MGRRARAILRRVELVLMNDSRFRDVDHTLVYVPFERGWLPSREALNIWARVWELYGRKHGLSHLDYQMALYEERRAALAGQSSRFRARRDPCGNA